MSELVEEKLSRTRTHKAQIHRRPDGLFRVSLLRWWEEDLADDGKMAAFWAEVPTAGSMTDTLEAAQKIATDLLLRHAPGQGDEQER